MTAYTFMKRIGPVSITMISAELVAAPPSYMAECQFEAYCEWGLAGIKSEEQVMQLSQEHADEHDKRREVAK